jgi:hypothetical protein
MEYATDEFVSGILKIQVLEIRRRYIPYLVTQQQLSEEYKVSRDCIGRIVRHKNWAWL